MASLTDLYALPGMPPFRPFLPGEAVQNPDGTHSTERSMTWQTPDGQWTNTPTLFMTQNGVLDLSAALDDAQARTAASILGKAGMEFPTFASPDEAEIAAVLRSQNEGAYQGPSFTWRK